MADKEQYHLSKPAKWIDKVIAGAVIGTEPMPELSDQFKAQFRENIGAADATAKWQPLGFFDTVEELKATITNPAPGDAYAVGVEEPFNIWVWDGLGKRWRDGGNMKGMDGAPGVDGAPGKDAIITPESITAGLGYTPGMVNPNLLDNWYFGDPVNHRGRTEYSGAIDTIDRWKSRSTSLEVTVNSDSITLTNSGTSSAYLTQYIKDNAVPAGEYTLSVLVDSVSGTPSSTGAYAIAYISTGSIAGSIRISGDGLFTTPITLTEPAANAQIQMVAGCSATIKAIKLELGSVQTLAHKDADGNWVLNEIPDYGEQLARCLRYFQRLTNQIIGYGYINANSAIAFAIPLMSPMRINTPTVSAGTFSIVCDGTTYSGFEIVSGSAVLSGDILKCNLSRSSGIPVKSCPFVAFSTGTLDVIAD